MPRESGVSNKVWLGWYYVLLDLAIHIIVVVQLELTLSWNHVSGLSILRTSLGQLVPFLIGIGGLALVSSRWVISRWVKWKRGAALSSGWEQDGFSAAQDDRTERRVESFAPTEDDGDIHVKWRRSKKEVSLAATCYDH